MCLLGVTDIQKADMIGYTVLEKIGNNEYYSLVFHKNIKYIRGKEYKAKNKEFGFTFFEMIDDAEDYLFSVERIKKHQNFVVVKCKFRQIEKTGAQEIGSFCDLRTAYTARYRTIIDEVFLDFHPIDIGNQEQVGLDKFLKAEI